MQNINLSYFASFLALCNHLDWEERAGCFTLSSWCLVTVTVLWLFLGVPWAGLQRVIVVFPDHTHLLFWWPSESYDLDYANKILFPTLRRFKFTWPSGCRGGYVLWMDK